MTEIIRRGRPGALPSIATLGVAASVVLSACTASPGPEPDGPTETATGVTPTASPTTDEPDGPTPTPTSETPDETPDATPTDDDTPSGDDTSVGDDTEEPPPFYANTLPDFGDAAGGTVGVLSDIRAGAQEGFDRVVFEFDGAGTPGWHVRYVDVVVGDPSGLELDVDGAAVLEVTLNPVPYPDDDPDAYAGLGRIRLTAAGSVTEVLLHSIFEGYLQAFVGVRPGEVPFRAFELQNPSRIVIEVQHPR